MLNSETGDDGKKPSGEWPGPAVSLCDFVLRNRSLLQQPQFIIASNCQSTLLAKMASHPRQRLTSPSRSLSLILHVLGVASFSYNFHFLTTWDTPFAKAYGWHFQFLTIIGLTSSLVAFAFGILADLTSIPVLFQAKNAVAVLATPLEVVISILYWGIRFIDTSLLIPDDFRLDLLPDVGFHLAPAVFLTLDLILFSPPWTISAYGIMTLSTVLAFAYWYWVELCFSHNGW